MEKISYHSVADAREFSSAFLAHSLLLYQMTELSCLFTAKQRKDKKPQGKNISHAGPENVLTIENMLSTQFSLTDRIFPEMSDMGDNVAE